MPSPARLPHVLGLTLLLVVVACNQDGGSSGADGDGTAGAEEPTCREDRLGDAGVVDLTGSDATAVAAEVATRTHRCADVVVVAPADDGWAATVAAAAAVTVDGPLILGDDPVVVDEALAALDAEEVLAVGDDAVAADDLDVPVTTVTAGVDGGAPAMGEAATLALAVADHIGAERILAVPADDAEARAALAGHLGAGDVVVPVPADDDAVDALADALPDGIPVVVLATDEDRAGAVADDLGGGAAPLDGPRWPEGDATTAWLVDPDQHAVTAVAVAAAAGRDEVLLPVDAGDLRRGRDRTARLRDVAPERLALVGNVTDHADWQLETVLEGDPYPHGGFALFDDTTMVALYGHPGAASLGALGQQDLEATLDRARAAAEPYDGMGGDALPALEIITTLASGSPTETGDYSSPTAIEVLRPWVDRAGEEGVAVVLDLQPGRTDFLTQARMYEELLLAPHVHLALDPEWRLGPDQVHMRQIGSVGAAEVQEVADWLAELTRTHRLPEKLLLLHQFKIAMLPDRDDIEAPPELAVVVHMDGHGSLSLKDGSYTTITAGAEDRWLWGWKNFYDVDPEVASPERTMGLDPRPVFVSYQ